MLKIKPKKILQGYHNQDFLEIKDLGKNPYDRLNVKVGKINNIPLSTNKLSSINSFLDYDAELIKFNENTYFDPLKQETIIGFGFESNPGYVLPYNFKGKFYPYLDLNVNDFKLRISWEINVDRAYFDENLSLFSLKVNNSNNSNIDNNDLNWKNIPSDFFNDINNEKLSFSYFMDKINEINSKNNIS